MYKYYCLVFSLKQINGEYKFVVCLLSGVGIRIRSDPKLFSVTGINFFGPVPAKMKKDLIITVLPVFISCFSFIEILRYCSIISDISWLFIRHFYNFQICFF